MTKPTVVGAMVAGIVAAAAAQDIVIDSISRNGTISFSGAAVGSTAIVEWAASLTDAGRTNWHGLTNVVVTNDIVTTDIPMFFRVRGTPRPITLTYTGTVYEANLVPSFHVGDRLQVTFTFVPSASDTSSGDPTVGNYYAITALSFMIQSYTGSVQVPAPIQVGNDYTGQGENVDYYIIERWHSQVQGDPVDGWTPIGLVLQFVDPTHNAFASDALPLSKLDPARFVSPNTYMAVTFSGPGGQTSSVNAHFAASP